MGSAFLPEFTSPFLMPTLPQPALILADELHESRLASGGVATAPAAAASDGVAEALNAVAARLEKIARSI